MKKQLATILGGLMLAVATGSRNPWTTARCQRRTLPHPALCPSRPCPRGSSHSKARGMLPRETGHSTRWRIVDRDHLIQDWVVLGGTKSVSKVHLEFTRRE
jgi:hypothetical protein